jgi:hypothetical protein
MPLKPALDIGLDSFMTCLLLLSRDPGTEVHLSSGEKDRIALLEIDGPHGVRLDQPQQLAIALCIQYQVLHTAFVKGCQPAIQSSLWVARSLIS